MGKNKGKRNRRSNGEEHQEQSNDSENEQNNNRLNIQRSEQQIDDDAISLGSAYEDEWITNSVLKEVKRRKTKNNPPKKYSTLEVCLLGIERIIASTRHDEFECMTFSGIESQMELCKMYHKKFFEATVDTNAIVAEELLPRKTIIAQFEQR